jgi:hypothetical protein
VEVPIDFHLHLCYNKEVNKGGTPITTTPNSPQELFNLNQQKQQVHAEEVLEVLDKLNPSQTALTVKLLLSRLETFHWNIVTDIHEGECEQPLQPWVHDATLISNCLQMFNNMTDFQD